MIISFLKNKKIKKFIYRKPLIYLFNLFNKLDHLGKPSKTIFLLIFEFLILTISFFLTNYLIKDGDNQILTTNIWGWSIPIMMTCSTLFYIFSGNYISISKYIRSSEIYNIGRRISILIIVVLLADLIFNDIIYNFKKYILFWIISTFINIVARFSIKEILNYSGYFIFKKSRRVAIYGAGAAGAQLASSLILAGSHEIITFFDDSPDLFGRKLLGIRIVSSKNIYKFKNKLDQILFAIPSLDKKKSKVIFSKIKEYKIPVLRVPSIQDLTKGNLSINELRPIEIEDLLGRTAVKPNKELLRDSTENLNICITGCGGSIGKEIFRQIINLNPKSLLLIDSNELSLYKLEKEIEDSSIKKNKPRIHLKLGDVKDFNLLKNMFTFHNIDIVFHSAAYKHVPLIERNPLQGIENNILSTYSICRAAKASNLSKVTLISTDKAVRPANVMGATKRFAELILQAFAEEVIKETSEFNPQAKTKNLKFAIVRFGNVLGSSGSVVPLFKKQIAAGGPITLTDENVIRYFMTISEAAQLVIQATSLAEGGDLFILDMGDPVKIKDLAEQMIRLSGLKVKTANHQNGDIEIITTGLRPGEKLYEELLIGGKPLKTQHPLIFKVNESKVSYKNLLTGINKFEKAIKSLDEKEALKVLAEFVPEWKNNESKQT